MAGCSRKVFPAKVSDRKGGSVNRPSISETADLRSLSVRARRRAQSATLGHGWLLTESFSGKSFRSERRIGQSAEHLGNSGFEVVVSSSETAGAIGHAWPWLVAHGKFFRQKFPIGKEDRSIGRASRKQRI